MTLHGGEPSGDRPSATNTSDISLSAVRKTYGDVVAVDGVDLDIRSGEFFTMLGPQARERLPACA